MRKVRREEILDYVTYQEQRDAVRAQLLEIKRRRRIHVAPSLMFLVENTDTIHYQVQEMVRAERIVKEADIQHELATYNELLGKPGELGLTLLIEIDDVTERNEKLVAWRGMMERVYAKLEDGTRVYATFDARQVGDDRLSSVQYLKLDTHGRVPVALGVDHHALQSETALSDEVREALREDLRSDW